MHDGAILQPRDLDDALALASVALPETGTVVLDIAEALLITIY